RYTRTLEQEAGRLGVELTVLDTPVLAETLFARLRPALVVGCFSTALLTASAFYGLPVARVGTDTLLDRLTPYENSNRIPVTVVDALLPGPDDAAAVAGRRGALDTDALQDLVRAVGFAMQPRILPGLRAEAERYLAARLDGRTRPYFKRRRLTSLGLPGGVPARLGFLPRSATVRRAARTARRRRRTVARGCPRPARPFRGAACGAYALASDSLAANPRNSAPAAEVAPADRARRRRKAAASRVPPKI